MLSIERGSRPIAKPLGTRGNVASRPRFGFAGVASSLLDEEHLLVGRERPKVVGNPSFESIDGGADGHHRG